MGAIGWCGGDRVERIVAAIYPPTFVERIFATKTAFRSLLRGC
jgi:hypothetical protein